MGRGMNKNLFVVLLIAVFSVSGQAEEYKLYSDDKVLLLAEVLDFDPDSHEIKYIDNGSSKPVIVSIDGRLPFGIKPIRFPQTEIVSLILKTGSKSYKLDSSAMYNPGLKGIFGSDSIYVNCFGEEDCVVRMLLSDAATAYVAEWTIKYGVAERTILTSQRDILHNMVANIKPPAFEE